MGRYIPPTGARGPVYTGRAGPSRRGGGGGSSMPSKPKGPTGGWKKIGTSKTGTPIYERQEGGKTYHIATTSPPTGAVKGIESTWKPVGKSKSGSQLYERQEGGKTYRIASDKAPTSMEGGIEVVVPKRKKGATREGYAYDVPAQAVVDPVRVRTQVSKQVSGKERAKDIIAFGKSQRITYGRGDIVEIEGQKSFVAQESGVIDPGVKVLGARGRSVERAEAKLKREGYKEAKRAEAKQDIIEGMIERGAAKEAEGKTSFAPKEGWWKRSERWIAARTTHKILPKTEKVKPLIESAADKPTVFHYIPGFEQATDWVEESSEWAAKKIFGEEKVTKAKKAVREFNVGFATGIYETIREKPLTVTTNVGLAVATGPVLTGGKYLAVRYGSKVPGLIKAGQVVKRPLVVFKGGALGKATTRVSRIQFLPKTSGISKASPGVAISAAGTTVARAKGITRFGTVSTGLLGAYATVKAVEVAAAPTAGARGGVIGRSVAGEVVPFAAGASAGARLGVTRSFMAKTELEFVIQRMPLQKQARFRELIKRGKSIGESAPVGEPTIMRTEYLPKKARGIVLRELRRDPNAVLGGSAVLPKGAKVIPKDVDIYYKGDPKVFQKRLIAAFKKANIKGMGVPPKGKAEITFGGKKAIEIHGFDKLATNIRGVKGAFEPVGARITTSPGGVRMLDLRTQLQRNIVGYYTDQRTKDIQRFRKVAKLQFGKRRKEAKEQVFFKKEREKAVSEAEKVFGFSKAFGSKKGSLRRGFVSQPPPKQVALPKPIKSVKSLKPVKALKTKPRKYPSYPKSKKIRAYSYPISKKAKAGGYPLPKKEKGYPKGIPTKYPKGVPVPPPQTPYPGSKPRKYPSIFGGSGAYPSGGKYLKTLTPPPTKYGVPIPTPVKGGPPSKVAVVKLAKKGKMEREVKKEKLGTRWKLGYAPVVEAAVFNIKGVKPPKTEIKSGLMFRPIIGR